MRVLAIDTSLGACSACILDTRATDAVSSETLLMERGHAEALLPLIDRVVAAVEGGFSVLDRVAVTVGPGSYTGIRVGIAAARGIALAAGLPAVGVATLSAYLAPLLTRDTRGLVAAAIDARHGSVFVQAVAPGGRTVIAPSLSSVREAVRVLGSGPVQLVGSGAALLAAECRSLGVEASVADSPAAPDIAWVARIGARADPDQALPKPLYLRGPDAKPQEGGRIARQ